MKKLLLATGLTFALAPNLVMAEETQIDPADVTQTNTFLWGQAGNKDYTLTGGIAGNLRKIQLPWFVRALSLLPTSRRSRRYCE